MWLARALKNSCLLRRFPRLGKLVCVRRRFYGTRLWKVMWVFCACEWAEKLMRREKKKKKLSLMLFCFLKLYEMLGHRVVAVGREGVVLVCSHPRYVVRIEQGGATVVVFTCDECDFGA